MELQERLNHHIWLVSDMSVVTVSNKIGVSILSIWKKCIVVENLLYPIKQMFLVSVIVFMETNKRLFVCLICLTAYQLFTGYSMLKFYSFVNYCNNYIFKVWLHFLLYNLLEHTLNCGIWVDLKPEKKSLQN